MARFRLVINVFADGQGTVGGGGSTSWYTLPPSGGLTPRRGLSRSIIATPNSGATFNGWTVSSNIKCDYDVTGLVGEPIVVGNTSAASTSVTYGCNPASIEGAVYPQYFDIYVNATAHFTGGGGGGGGSCNVWIQVGEHCQGGLYSVEEPSPGQYVISDNKISTTGTDGDRAGPYDWDRYWLGFKIWELDEGYTFDHWETNWLPQPVYTPNMIQLVPSQSDAVLKPYAVLSTYQISYDGNGNTGGTVPGNQTKTYGQPLTLSSNTLTKDSSTSSGYTISFNSHGGSSSPSSITAVNTTTYTHDGWSTSSTGSKEYNKGGSYTLNEPATLFAHWSTSETKGSITLPNPGTKSGYSFDGWYTSETGGTKRGDAGGTYTPTSSETLHAHWVLSIARLTVTAGTGGSLASDSATTGDYTIGNNVTVKAVASKGYIFSKWQLSGGSSASSTNASFTFAMPSSATTATASFTAKSCTVNLNKGGGTGGTNSVTATYNSAMPSITVPSRTGYKFLGYYDAETGGTQYYTSTGSSAKNWDKDTTSATDLYAHWQANKYTVTLNRNGGTGGSTSIQATYGSAMPSATMPTRKGYDFSGYYDATTGGTQYYNADGTSTRNWNKASDSELYARWVRNDSCWIWVYNGSQWEFATIKQWNGSSWVEASIYKKGSSGDWIKN